MTILNESGKGHVSDCCGATITTFYRIKNGQSVFNYWCCDQCHKICAPRNVMIPIEYAKNIHKVLEDHVHMGFKIVSTEIKEIVSEEAYAKLMDIFNKYHNANCDPFNRTLKRLIEKAEGG